MNQLRRPTERIYYPEPRFHGEQDGPLERALKGRLAQLFRHDGDFVLRAYLVRTSSGHDEGAHIVLGLVTRGAADEALVERIGEVFASLFAGNQHLDVVFLDPEHEAKVKHVCAPFYRPSVGRQGAV